MSDSNSSSDSVCQKEQNNLHIENAENIKELEERISILTKQFNEFSSIKDKLQLLNSNTTQVEVIQLHESRIRELEFVLFQTDSNSQSQLFQQIYDRIDITSLKHSQEEETLHQIINLLKQQQNANVLRQEQTLSAHKTLQDQCDQITAEYHKMNTNMQLWQDSYFNKSQQNQRQIVDNISVVQEEIQLTKNLITRQNESLYTLQQRCAAIETYNQILDKSSKEMYNQIQKYSCEIDKIQLIMTRLERQEAAHTKLRNTSENHENHYALIEGYVEKYLPIQIHDAISKTLHATLNDKTLLKLADFEKRRVQELHQLVLHDDGIPKLAHKIKEIRTNINLLGNVPINIQSQRHEQKYGSDLRSVKKSKKVENQPTQSQNQPVDKQLEKRQTIKLIQSDTVQQSEDLTQKRLSRKFTINQPQQSRQLIKLLNPINYIKKSKWEDESSDSDTSNSKEKRKKNQQEYDSETSLSDPISNADEVELLYYNQKLIAKRLNKVMTLPTKVQYLLQEHERLIASQMNSNLQKNQSHSKEVENYVQSLHSVVTTCQDKITEFQSFIQTIKDLEQLTVEVQNSQLQLLHLISQQTKASNSIITKESTSQPTLTDQSTDRVLSNGKLSHSQVDQKRLIEYKPYGQSMMTLRKIQGSKTRTGFYRQASTPILLPGVVNYDQTVSVGAQGVSNKSRIRLNLDTSYNSDRNSLIQ